MLSMCLLFCFVIFWILCCVVCEKNKKLLITKKEYQPSRSCWRGEWKHNGCTLLPLCIRAASALPLLCETAVNQALLKRLRWKHLSSRDQCYNVLLWSSADHALAQVRPRKCFTRTLSKSGRKSKALYIYIYIYIYMCVYEGDAVCFYAKA